jgi:O-acetyl-ADP-ribose deacetylase (regulator of RNase III)
MGIIRVIRADITTLEVDAIVNAANEHLQHGGGVALAISRAAGPELQAESNEVAPVPTGHAKATGAYNLNAKWVIHAVGPRWFGGENQEPELLESAYRESMKRAKELGAESIAFPSISTAIFGYPIELAAPIAMKVLVEEVKANPTLTDVIMCTFSETDLAVYSNELSKY